MKNNKDVNTKTEEIMTQVADITDKLFARVNRVDFNEERLDASSLDDLRTHLGYTKSYTDLAKVRLQYMKYGE